MPFLASCRGGTKEIHLILQDWASKLGPDRTRFLELFSLSRNLRIMSFVNYDWIICEIAMFCEKMLMCIVSNTDGDLL